MLETRWRFGLQKISVEGSPTSSGTEAHCFMFLGGCGQSNDFFKCGGWWRGEERRSGGKRQQPTWWFFVRSLSSSFLGMFINRELIVTDTTTISTTAIRAETDMPNLQQVSSVTSSSPSTPPSALATQVLVHAEARYIVGRYRVPTSQIQPHPVQRLLSSKWVDTLLDHFVKVGVDRFAHPIKVVLQDSEDACCLPAATASTEVALLPSHVRVLVYHGQHRVAACQRMMEEEEHWWIAEVYRPGERIHVSLAEIIG